MTTIEELLDIYQLRSRVYGRLSYSKEFPDAIEHENKGLNQEFKLLTKGVYFTMINNGITATMSVMSEEHYRWYDRFGGFQIEERFESYGNIGKPFIITSWDVAKVSDFFKRLIFYHEPIPKRVNSLDGKIFEFRS